MHEELKSNITIASNISDTYQNVVGFKELTLLVNKGFHSLSHEKGVLWHRGAIPYYCTWNNRHNQNDKTVWGFIKNEEGTIVQSCRCENSSCDYYDKCMQEPYAKKILRSIEGFAEEHTEFIEEPEWTSWKGKST